MAQVTRRVSDTPPPGHALVRVRRVGVCGTDLHAFKGEQPFFTFPRVLGHELGVEVVAVGDGDSTLAAGTLCAVEPYLACGSCVACRRGRPNCCCRIAVLGVHIDGGLTEWLTVPVANLHPSTTLSPDQLAMVEPLSIGAHAVARAALPRDEVALVIGVGPIGLAVLQSARLAGARTIAMDTDQERLRFAQRYVGAEHSVVAGPSALDEIRALTRGDMPLTVFDVTGSRQSVERAFSMVAHGGTLVLVGLFQGHVTFDDADAHRRELTLLRSRNATSADFARVMRHLEDGAIDVTPWITHRAALADLPAEFPRWLAPERLVIKAVVDVSPSPAPEPRRP